MKRAKHILLVDDNEVDNFIAEHILKVRNAAELITMRTSAIEALDFLEHQVKEMHRFPDYIFLDISMPQMDGFRFLKEYAKFPESMKKQCSIIMITSSEDKKDRERARYNPLIKNYLLKPLSDYKIEDILI
jgi:CheY-like chemotaxis protein